MTPPPAIQSTPMVLADFLNRHAGETAWLFGKGPSLSTFNFKNAGPIRAAINDVAAHVPDCLYAFANDGVAKWAELYPCDVVLFQPRRALAEYDPTLPGRVACKVVVFEDQHNDPRMLMPREELAKSLTIRRGTLGSALQILHIMGIRRIYAIGIDGGQAHAPGYQWRTRLRNDHWKDYDAIRFAAIDAAELIGIELRFHNQNHTMTTDGKVFVQFKRTCAAEGIHYSQGEIAKINPRIARELIACNAAEIFDAPPAKQAADPIETAESKPMQAAENATVATKKGRGKK